MMFSHRLNSDTHHVLLSAGSNAKGQLGIRSYDDAHTFTPCQFAGCEPDRLPTDTTVTHIACGANHTVLLLKRPDGTTTLWGAGDGRKGQLGPDPLADISDIAEDSDPASSLNVFHKLDLRLTLPTSLQDRGGAYTPHLVAAAWETTYVVFSLHPSGVSDGDGSDVLLAMGSNDFGALGVGGGESTGIARSGIVALDHVLLPNDDDPKRPRTTRIRIRSLHAGPRHVVAELVVSRSDASSSLLQAYDAQTRRVLVGWGASRHGQLGPSIQNVNVGGGTARFVARPTILPIDVDEDPMVSCALGNQHTVVLHASGRVSCLGSNKQGQIPPPSSLSSVGRGVCGIGCTWNGMYVQTRDEDGHVLASMGNNAQGQLGRGDTAVASTGRVGLPADRTISTFVCGSEHVLVVTSGDAHGEGDSVVLGWGWNEHGNMGLGSLGNVSLPTQLWPREDVEKYREYPQRVTGIWAGCATSWLLVE